MRNGVTLDPAVAAVLGDGQRRARRRGMNAGERRRAAADAARSKMTLDLTPAVMRELRATAEREQCSASSLAAGLLEVGLEALGRGEMELEMRPSRSPRFLWIVEGVGRK